MATGVQAALRLQASIPEASRVGQSKLMQGVVIVFVCVLGFSAFAKLIRLLRAGVVCALPDQLTGSPSRRCLAGWLAVCVIDVC